MKIIFSDKISKKEKLTEKEIIWLIKAYQKGIFQFIKGEFLPKRSRLAKLYMTTVLGARRAVFLVDMEFGTAFFLFFRSKKDSIGANISIKNAKFKESLRKYLLFLNEDIQGNQFSAYERG